MRKELTEKQRKVFQEGEKGEIEAAKWLKEHGFYSVKRNTKPTGCWDIMARRGKDKWIIEVKTGEEPKINLSNFEKMIRMKGFTKIGLALVTEHYVHILEYPKMRFAAFKAWDTMRKEDKQE